MPDIDPRWTAEGLGHGLRPLTGRDPHASERAATPLELLFNLVFVVAFGQAGNQFAHLVAEGHWQAGLGGFIFAMFAVVWAWIQFTWFASAYDTDDWGYRLATMTIMVGVLILALGLPEMFHALDEGRVENRVMVAGYVVMRVAMVALWHRVIRADSGAAAAARKHKYTIIIAQLGWVALAFTNPSIALFAAGACLLAMVELGGPYLAERNMGGIPWHPHHIAERYGLLMIIALGEGVIGTVAAVTVLIEADGWTAPAIVIAVAGIGLTFALWWIYFSIPWGELLHRRRHVGVVWGYTHFLLYAAIAAVGAGLHVAALVAEHHAEITTFGAIFWTALPVGVFLVIVSALYLYVVEAFDEFRVVPLAFCLVLLGAACWLASSGVSLALCLVAVLLSPVAMVVTYEVAGRAHLAELLARIPTAH